MVLLIKFISAVLWCAVFLGTGVAFLRTPNPDLIDYLSAGPLILIGFSLMLRRGRWLERSLDAFTSDVAYALGYEYTPIDGGRIDRKNAFPALGNDLASQADLVSRANGAAKEEKVE